VYAVISDRSKQFTVREGDVILCDLTDTPAGETVTFDEVLLVGHEGETKIGKPLVEGAKVEGEALEPIKGDKVVAFRFKRRKGVRVKMGHRQPYTPVKITGISA